MKPLMKKLEEKRLILKEKYNFDYDEKEDCFSYTFDGKKAFIINVSNSNNYFIIPKLVLKRIELTAIADYLHKIPNKNLNDEHEAFIRYIGLSIQIVRNLLDQTKMSVDYFMFNVTNILQSLPLNEILPIITNLILMLDISNEINLDKISNKDMDLINKEFADPFKNIRNFDDADIFMIDETGEAIKIGTSKDVKITIDNDEYGLANMTPINKEVI